MSRGDPEMDKRALLDPGRWRIALPEDHLRYLENLESRKLVLSRWASDGSVSPSDLYCYLSARFGAPSGTLSRLREDSSDNLFHWHFVVVAGDGFVEFLSSNGGTEAWAWGSEQLKAEDWEKLVEGVKADFGRVSDRMGSVRRSLEHWVVFINPFRRIQRTVDKMSDELEQIEIVEPDLPTSQREYEAFVERLSAWQASLQRGNELGLMLRFLCPVLAESFVNLLMLVLGREDIKSDKRLYDARIRDKIHVRLRSLHLNCDSFLHGLSPKATQFKDVLRLMNRRNDLLHGNIDPMKLVFDELFFDGTVPVFMEEDVLPLRLPRKAARQVAPELAKRDVQIVRDFVDYVLSLLDPQVRPDIEKLMGEEQLGWRSDAGKVGILFDRWLPLGVFGSGEGSLRLLKPS